MTRHCRTPAEFGQDPADWTATDDAWQHRCGASTRRPDGCVRCEMDADSERRRAEHAAHIKFMHAAEQDPADFEALAADLGL